MNTWPIKKLNDVCTFKVTKNTKKLPYIGMEDIESGTGRFIGDSKAKEMKSTTAYFDKTNVLYGKLRPYLNKVFLPDFEGHCSTEFVPLTPNPKLLAREWLSKWLMSSYVVEEVNKNTTGTRMPRANLNYLKNLEIPLPPLETQKKIVSKIEELMGRIEEVKKLRVQVQKDTADLLPAALHKIFEEGKNKGWEEKRIEDIVIEIKSGFACSKQNEVLDGVVHLRTHNINIEGDINLNKVTQIPEKLVDKNAYGIMVGDILFNNTNSTELVGKTAIARTNYPFAFSNHITRIRVDKGIVLPDWILFIFLGMWRSKYFESICNRWVGQSGINQTTLKKIKILVPSIEDQKEIVEYLNSLSEKVRKIQELQSKTENELKELEQSILYKAFSGELLTS